MTSRRMQLFVPLALLLAAFFAAPAVAAPPAWKYFSIGPGGVIHPEGVAIPSELVYQNEQPNFEPTAVAQEGDEWADDVHCIRAGSIYGFGAGFDGQPKGDFEVTLTLYDSETSDTFNSGTGPGGILLGPYTFAVDQNTIGIFVFGFSGPSAGPDLWIGARFSDPTMGLTRHNPPGIGTSTDGYWNVTDGDKGDFAGNPVANFVGSIEMLAPVPVEPSTWGRIKSLLPVGN